MFIYLQTYTFGLAFLSPEFISVLVEGPVLRNEDARIGRGGCAARLALDGHEGECSTSMILKLPFVTLAVTSNHPVNLVDLHDPNSPI